MTVNKDFVTPFGQNALMTVMSMPEESCEMTELKTAFIHAFIKEGGNLYQEDRLRRTVWSYCQCTHGSVEVLHQYWNPSHVTSSGRTFLHEWWDDDFLCEHLANKDELIIPMEKVRDFMRPYLVQYWDSGLSLEHKDDVGTTLFDIVCSCFACSKEIVLEEYERYRLASLCQTSFNVSSAKPKSRL